MASSPVLEWRNVGSPNAVITSLAMTGTGFAGAIPIGTTSNTVVARIYNNFSAAASIADATNCIIASYDDTTHQGTAIAPATTGLYLSVEVNDYNGTTTGADTLFYAIGGSTKHSIPVNSGLLSGTGANYCTVTFQLSVPANAAQGAVSQGVWLEFSSTA